MPNQKITSGLEDYIESISNHLKKNNKVRAIDIANELKVSRASVSEALKRLAELGYINYGRYGAITITTEGEIIANSVIRRHTILHKFLCEHLGLEKDEAADNACKIEHVISENMLNRLDLFMKFVEQSYPGLSMNFQQTLE